MVTVERAMKVHVDDTFPAILLKLNHLNVVKVLHSEEDLIYRLSLKPIHFYKKCLKLMALLMYVDTM